MACIQVVDDFGNKGEPYQIYKPFADVFKRRCRFSYSWLRWLKYLLDIEAVIYRGEPEVFKSSKTLC